MWCWSACVMLPCCWESHTLALEELQLCKYYYGAAEQPTEPFPLHERACFYVQTVIKKCYQEGIISFRLLWSIIHQGHTDCWRSLRGRGTPDRPALNELMCTIADSGRKTVIAGEKGECAKATQRDLEPSPGSWTSCCTSAVPKQTLNWKCDVKNEGKKIAFNSLLASVTLLNEMWVEPRRSDR